MMVSPEPDSKTDTHDEPDWGYLVTHATDTYWWLLTGMCGGCGRSDCHQLPCPSRPGVGFCLTCPTRRETGEVRGAR